MEASHCRRGFEIVRRRLFEPITDPQKFAARDAVVAAFGNAYREQSQEFPNHCREASYERRMRDAYPIHPELFDRLYGKLVKFGQVPAYQGVLRLMATVIHGLWERGDGNLLIMPGTVPIDDPSSVNHELNRYLDDNWQPIIEKNTQTEPTHFLSVWTGITPTLAAILQAGVFPNHLWVQRLPQRLPAWN